MHKLFTGALSIERITVPITGLPPHLQGTKIVQLSDFHYENKGLSDTLLHEAIAATNAAEPDLIVLTGDYITEETAAIHALAPHLKHLQSRLGIYAVLGNHDNHNADQRAEIIQALTHVGIDVLWNAIAYPWGDELPLVGLADFWSKEFNPKPVFKKLDRAVPRIVLSHNPDSAIRLKSWRVDLQLSGHTHGGQIVLPKMGIVLSWLDDIRRSTPRTLRRHIPFLRKRYFRVVNHWKFSQGLHAIGSNLLYVNRGLGTYAPGRLFCPPEVTVITLINKTGDSNSP